MKDKLKTTKFYLTKANEEVVKPLMEEIKTVEEAKQLYKTKYEKNFDDL